MASPPMAAIDALAMAAVIEANATRWGWSQKFKAIIVGKLTRGSRAIAPLEAEAAATIASLCAEGWGLWHALKSARVTQRRYYAWLAKAHSSNPDAGPYKDFRNRLAEVFNARVAEGMVYSESDRRMLLP